MKYQRLSVLTRQLAAVFVNIQPGMEEPVNEADLWPLVFDNIKPKPQPQKYTPEEWDAEQKRVREQFEKMNLN